MTDMPSEFEAQQAKAREDYLRKWLAPDEQAIYAGRNPAPRLAPTRWQRAKWIAHDDVVALREYVADLLWNLSEWIRP
jgi:hypothetical protein